MQSWYYQVDSYGRGFIDSEKHPGCTQNSQVRAHSWLGAKAALGFEMTPLQLQLLAAQHVRMAS